MSITIKDSDAADVVIAPVGFNGLNQSGRATANTATFTQAFETKHTLATPTVPGRHLLSGKVRRYDAVTGKWGEAIVNLTITKDASGIVLLDDVEDILAVVLNYFTKNATAMPAGFTTELQKFLDGVSPF